MPNPEAIIRLSNVSVTYGGTRVVEPTNLEIERGLTAVIGPSGAGKSTLGAVIHGLKHPTEGEVTYHPELTNVDYVNGPEATPGRARRFVDAFKLETWVERARAQHLSDLGYIAQRPRLDPNLTGAEYVVLPQRVRGHEPNGEWLDYLANQLDIAPHLGKYASELSGGQAQRVAIMAALAHEPSFVYADEPTSALDVEMGAQTFELFQNISHDNGISVLCVTHNPDVSDYADRIIYMRDGVASDQPLVDPAG